MSIITSEAHFSNLASQSRRRRVYHQAAGECTLTRDEIQGRISALDDIPTCVG